jgi:hypothetical protein
MIHPWWEVEELLDHLKDRPDLWTRGSEGRLWVRYEGDDAVCALQLVPPKGTGPYRQYTVIAKGLKWPQEGTEKYVVNLFRHFTSYDERLRTQKILQEGLGLDERKASLGAIAIGAAVVEDDPDPECSHFPPAPATVAEDLPDHLTYALYIGGYLKLIPRGERLEIQISIPVNAKYGGGFPPIPLRGFVRAFDGHTELATAFLAGTAVTASVDPRRTESETDADLDQDPVGDSNS